MQNNGESPSGKPQRAEGRRGAATKQQVPVRSGESGLVGRSKLVSSKEETTHLDAGGSSPTAVTVMRKAGLQRPGLPMMSPTRHTMTFPAVVPAIVARIDIAPQPPRCRVTNHRRRANHWSRNINDRRRTGGRHRHERNGRQRWKGWQRQADGDVNASRASRSNRQSRNPDCSQENCIFRFHTWPFDAGLLGAFTVGLLIEFARL